MAVLRALGTRKLYRRRAGQWLPTVAAAGSYVGTTVFDFEASAQGWGGDACTVARTTTVAHDGTGSLAVTANALTNTTGKVFIANDSNNNTMLAAGGKELRAWVLVPTAATGNNWRGAIALQNSSFQYQIGANTTLTPGTWAELTYTPTAATWSNHKAVAVQFTVDNPTAATQTVYVDTLRQGALGAGPVTPPADTGLTTATVNLASVYRDLGPDGATFAGTCSSTYGRRPSTSTEQAAAEQALDARFWRLPVRWNAAGGYIATSALGAGSFSIEPDIALYYGWGHRMVLVIAGQGGDFGTWTAGDAASIAQRLVTLGYDLNRFDFSSSNEPGIDGSVLPADKTPQKILDRSLVIWNELQTVQPGRGLWGPVHFMYNRPELQFHQAGMAGKLEGTNYHHYAMGGNNDPQTTAWAFAHTLTYEQEVAEIQADAASRGASTAVNVDELNLSVKPDYGTPEPDGYIFPGDGQLREGRLFRAENTVWIASALGHVLRAGGRGMPYATQNKSLGVMVQNEFDGNTANLPEAGGVQRPESSPMPAYWGIAAWTGGGAPAGPRSFPHMNRRFFTTSSSDADTEVYAVDNEAAGYNLVVINKRAGASRDVQLDLAGLPAGWTWTRHRTRKANPYDPFVSTASTAVTGGQITLVMEACTVSVVVLAPPTAAQPRLTMTSGGVIQRNGTAWRTGGVNVFQLALNDYPNVNIPSQAAQTSLLDKAATMKAGLVRAHTLGASVGNSLALVTGVSGTTTPVITYNAAAWAAIDYAVWQASIRGLYLMVPMVDELGYYHGGKRHWVNFRRPGTVSLDYNVKASNSSTQRTAENYFYSDSQIKADFKQFLTDYANHVNPHTGRANKNEPALAIIETGNELWTAAQDAPTWTPEIAAHLASVWPLALIADGSASDGSDPSTHAWASADIDILGTHPYSTYGAAQVTSQAAFAASKGKAYLVGEYPWSKTAAPAIEQAVRESATFTSALWSLQNDGDLHNAGAGYGGDDASFYIPGKNSTETAAVARVTAHHQSLIDTPTSPPAAVGVALADDFNRPDAATLGVDWQQFTTSAGITGGAYEAKGALNAVARHVTDTTTGRQYAEITLRTLGAVTAKLLGPAVLMPVFGGNNLSAIGDFYWFGLSGTDNATVALRRKNDFSYGATLLGTTVTLGAALKAGDVMRAEITADLTELVGYVNGAEVIRRPMALAPLTTGTSNRGVGLYSTGNPEGYLTESWSGGDAAST